LKGTTALLKMLFEMDQIARNDRFAA